MTNYLYHIESFLHTLENSFQGFSKVKSNLYTFENDILGNNGEIKSPSDSKKAKMTTRKKSNNDDATNTSPLKRVNFAKTLNQRKFSDMYQFNKIIPQSVKHHSSMVPQTFQQIKDNYLS